VARIPVIIINIILVISFHVLQQLQLSSCIVNQVVVGKWGKSVWVSSCLVVVLSPESVEEVHMVELKHVCCM